ncbi:MAG: hypothetical protein AAB225_31195, partial [Acidobacteriota bacterium]
MSNRYPRVALASLFFAFAQPAPKPSDVFPNYNDPGTIIEITGVLTEDGCGYNSVDPDCHYKFIADAQFADLVDTLGTSETHEGHEGEVAPEQDGYVSDCEVAWNNGGYNRDLDPAPGHQRDWGLHPRSYDACRLDAGAGGKRTPPNGWIPLEGRIEDCGTPGVYWAWDPRKDSSGRDLKKGDHIRMVGRLRYDHENLVKGCWDTGSTSAAFRSRPQGHTEIHPIDRIEVIPPLPPDAETVVTMSVCVQHPLFGEAFKELHSVLTPAAPRPSGSSVIVEEDIDGRFTVYKSIVEKRVEKSADGAGVNVYVKVRGKGEEIFGEGAYNGKFRARYRLRWSQPQPPRLSLGVAVQPEWDRGRFNLQIDGLTVATDVGDGGSTGSQTLAEGVHRVSQTAATGTDLSQYQTRIGGACAPDGTITLSPNDDKVCHIRNTGPIPATLTVKLDAPPGRPPRLLLRIDGIQRPWSVPVPMQVGVHRVSVLDAFGYTIEIGGECQADGTITLVTGDRNTCTVKATPQPDPEPCLETCADARQACWDSGENPRICHQQYLESVPIFAWCSEGRGGGV